MKIFRGTEKAWNNFFKAGSLCLAAFFGMAVRAETKITQRLGRLLQKF